MFELVSHFNTHYVDQHPTPTLKHRYNSRPRKVAIPFHHHPPSCYIKVEDPDLPAFHFDPVVNPVSAFRSSKQDHDEDEELDEELVSSVEDE